MNARRVLVAMAATALLIPAAATAAHAAPPANDTVSGATAVVLPTTISEDTSEATTDSVDAGLNALCLAPATNGSVWFTYTDTSGAGFTVDVASSGFSAGVMIVAGNPEKEGVLVACGPDRVSAGGTAGTTYYVMAFSDTIDVPGGKLVASFEEAPPAPTAALTVDPRATALKDGSLEMRGTYSCSNAQAYQSDINGRVVQTVGRMKIEAYFFAYPLNCDGETHSWKAIATSQTGLFSGGKAASVTAALACGSIGCAVSEVDQTVQVTRAR